VGGCLFTCIFALFAVGLLNGGPVGRGISVSIFAGSSDLGRGGGTSST